MNQTKRTQPKNNLASLIQPDDPETSNDETQPTSPKTESKRRTAPSREGKKQVCAHINKKAFHQLHILRLEKDTSIEELIREGLNALFTMNDKPPIA